MPYQENDLVIVTRSDTRTSVGWNVGSIWRVEQTAPGNAVYLRYVMGPRPNPPHDHSSGLYMDDPEDMTDKVTPDLIRQFRNNTPDHGTEVTRAWSTTPRLVAWRDPSMVNDVDDDIGFSPQSGFITRLYYPSQEDVRQTWNVTERVTIGNEDLATFVSFITGNAGQQESDARPPQPGDVYLMDRDFESASVPWQSGSVWRVAPPPFQHDRAVFLNYVNGPRPGGEFGDPESWGNGGLWVFTDDLVANATRTVSAPVSEPGTVRAVNGNTIMVTTAAGEPEIEVREENGFRITTTREPIGGGEQMYVAREAMEAFVQTALDSNGIGHQDPWTVDVSDYAEPYTDRIGRYSDVPRYTWEGREFVQVEGLRQFMRSLRDHYNWCGVSERVMTAIEAGLDEFTIPSSFQVTVVATVYREAFGDARFYGREAADGFVRDRLYRHLEGRDDFTYNTTWSITNVDL